MDPDQHPPKFGLRSARFMRRSSPRGKAITTASPIHLYFQGMSFEICLRSALQARWCRSTHIIFPLGRRIAVVDGGYRLLID